MNFPTSDQVKSLGINVGVVCVNEGRNRLSKGVKVEVTELTEVGTVFVKVVGTGYVTTLLASDLYPI